MAYEGKVAWCTEQDRYYAIPDEVEDRLVNPDKCRTVNWFPDNDDPEDRGGHFELVPEGEDTYPRKDEAVGNWDQTGKNPMQLGSDG